MGARHAAEIIREGAFSITRGNGQREGAQTIPALVDRDARNKGVLVFKRPFQRKVGGKRGIDSLQARLVVGLSIGCLVDGLRIDVGGKTEQTVKAGSLDRLARGW